MAIYHCCVKTGSRENGQSAIAAAAYRSGTKLYENETGLSSDYTKKKGVIFSEISLCKNAPSEYKNRETLWNAVQKIESAKNSRLWREIEVALPKELNREQQIKVVREFVEQLTVQGMCADWSLHDKGDGNPHAHIMLTTRSIEPSGKWAPKSKKIYDLDENGNKIPIIDKKTGQQKVDSGNRKQWKNHKEDYNNWNDNERVEEWRNAWETVCNKYLSEDRKIDHRSFKRQGKVKIPTIHEGYAARAIERRGEVSERAEHNRAVGKLNAFREEVKKYRAEEKTIHEEMTAAQAELQEIASKAEKEKAVSLVPLENYANKILELRNRYFQDSINLSIKRSLSLSTNRHKLAMKTKAEEAEKAVYEVPKLAEKIRRLAETIKSLFFRRKEKQELMILRSRTVTKLQEKMKPIIDIGIGQDYDCENPTEVGTNDVCRKACAKIEQIKTEAEAEQKKVDVVEKYSYLTDDTVAADLEQLRTAVSDIVSKVSESDRIRLVNLVNKPYKTTGNNRVPLKAETEYAKLISLAFDDASTKEKGAVTHQQNNRHNLQH